MCGPASHTLSVITLKLERAAFVNVIIYATIRRRTLLNCHNQKVCQSGYYNHNLYPFGSDKTYPHSLYIDGLLESRARPLQTRFSDNIINNIIIHLIMRPATS